MDGQSMFEQAVEPRDGSRVCSFEKALKLSFDRNIASTPRRCGHDLVWRYSSLTWCRSFGRFLVFSHTKFVCWLDRKFRRSPAIRDQLLKKIFGVFWRSSEVIAERVLHGAFSLIFSFKCNFVELKYLFSLGPPSWLIPAFEPIKLIACCET